MRTGFLLLARYRRPCPRPGCRPQPARPRAKTGAKYRRQSRVRKRGLFNWGLFRSGFSPQRGHHQDGCRQRSRTWRSISAPLYDIIVLRVKDGGIGDDDFFCALIGGCFINREEKIGENLGTDHFWFTHKAGNTLQHLRRRRYHPPRRGLRDLAVRRVATSSKTAMTSTAPQRRTQPRPAIQPARASVAGDKSA